MADTQKPNIVLVHGAFADGSSWGRVIPPLARDGYHVTAVQIPLTSVADDVAVARRVIDAQDGPTVVVGHSYGGCVITQAAHGAGNVRALVYLAAMAPDEGETNGALAARFPAPLLAQCLRPDAAGFAYVDRARFHEVFCADVDAETALVMAAAQKPIAGSTFGDPCGPAAWHDVPTFFQVSEDDHAIHPDQERWEAERMGATTLALRSSHVAMISHPQEVAALIREAAGAAAGGTR
jgi:pimeloyl-ACP methyl ester carboxylesterase